MTSFLVSVNAGRSQSVPWGQLKRSAIDKRPLDGRVHVHRLGLALDEQAAPYPIERPGKS